MYRILELNPQLAPFAGDIDLRMRLYKETKERLLSKGGDLSTFANAYVLNCIVVEAVNMLVEEGVNPPIWKSGNCAGGDEWNAQFIDRFRDRIRCL